MTEETQEIEQTLGQFHRVSVSSNKRFIVFGESVRYLSVYIDCDVQETGIRYYDAASGRCASCNDTEDRFLVTSGNSQTC